jgi:DNA polymerase zeta
VPLIKSVRTPEEFLETPGAIINAEYYITRAIIPALERCFSLLAVDVRVWYVRAALSRVLFFQM